MRLLAVVAGSYALLGCERASAPPAPPPTLAPAPSAEPTSPPLVTAHEPPPAPGMAAPTAHAHSPHPATAIPMPPSDEPAEYAAWLAAQTGAERQRIAAYCRARPVAYDLRCGGIGPLHIPYSPMPRARAWRPGDLQSRYATYDAWNAVLSPAQHRYIEAHCRGGEDQPSSALCGDNTPLVAAFDDEPVEFAAGGGAFAFAAGAPVATDWPTARTPWIALDRDGNGAIDGGAELFGDHTGGARYANGFAALATLDANHDGQLDASDPEFAALVLWSDRDGDHASRGAELRPLSATIVSISLGDRLDARCDERGNCEGERARMVWRDATGALHRGSVIDVYLPVQPRLTGVTPSPVNSLKSPGFTNPGGLQVLHRPRASGTWRGGRRGRPRSGGTWRRARRRRS